MARLKSCKAPACSVRKPRDELMGPRKDYCCSDCGFQLAKSRLEASRARKAARELKERKQALKSLSALCAAAQKDVNRYIMARDRLAGHGCISCGSLHITEAGHYFHAGSKYRTSRFRFDHRVINAQCNHCNQHVGGGNQHGYRLGYIARYGEAAFEEMVEAKRQADSGELEPLTKAEVIEIAAQHRQMTRELLRPPA